MNFRKENKLITVMRGNETVTFKSYQEGKLFKRLNDETIWMKMEPFVGQSIFDENNYCHVDNMERIIPILLRKTN